MKQTTPTTPPGNDSINEWRSPNERAELVERVIKLTSENNMLRRTIRELTEAAAGDEPFGAYITLLQSRITVLEDNVERLVRKLERTKAA